MPSVGLWVVKGEMTSKDITSWVGPGGAAADSGRTGSRVGCGGLWGGQEVMCYHR